MAVRQIIFDLGKVLIDYDHRVAAEKIATRAKRPADEILERFYRSKLTLWLDQGKIEPEAFYGKIRQRLRLKLTYEEFIPIWNEVFTFTPDNRRVYELALALKPRFTLSILSNTNKLHLGYVRSAFPVFGAFHRVFASCEMGYVKPQPKIYSLCLRELGARPAEVFYTDDNPDFIEKARTMGFRAFVYAGPAQLEKDLSRCGITL